MPAGTTNVLVSIRAEDVVMLQAGGAWQTSARNVRLSPRAQHYLMTFPGKHAGAK